MTLKNLGRYEIVDVLGRGAMGVVYRAHDPLIERTVAIKTISYAGLSPQEVDDFEQRFFREAKSAGKLNHPNIVTIYDVGHSEELAYIAMEFLSGASLRTLLDSGVVLPLERIVTIAAGVADGLAFAHASGVVHRDIKPANIMVLDNGAVKIADFGIAQLPGGDLTMVGTALGSPKYMSPEQVLGQKADGRSDIFSLGAVVYEMLTGRSPFAAEDLNAILYRVLNSEVPPPSLHNPGFPAEFDRIVARALAKKPEDRYQDVEEMARDLRSCPTATLADRHLPEVPPTSAAAGDETVVVKRDDRLLDGAKAKRLRVLRTLLPIAALAMLAGGGVYWLRPKAVPPQIELPPVMPASNLAEDVRQIMQRKNAESPAEPSIEKKEVDSRAPEARRPPKEVDARPTVASEEAKKEAPAKRPAEASAKNWYAALRADLNACSQKPFVKRIYCNERARWRHCPGHWGTVDECPKKEAPPR